MAALLARNIVPQLARSCILPTFSRSFGAAVERIIYIKDDETYNTLKKGERPCIMNFSASWCGPCKMMAPHFAAMSATNDHVNFVKIDIDECQNIQMEEGITSVPTYKLYKNNKVISQFAGASLGQLEAMVELAKK